VAAPRVGVPYAGAWAHKPWRFYVADSPWVSRVPRAGRRRGRRVSPAGAGGAAAERSNP
jgi:DNA-3-methyladenine glycosylase